MHCAIAQGAQFWAVNYRWKIYCPSFDSLAASLVKVFESFLRKGGNYKETKCLATLKPFHPVNSDLMHRAIALCGLSVLFQ